MKGTYHVGDGAGVERFVDAVVCLGKVERKVGEWWMIKSSLAPHSTTYLYLNNQRRKRLHIALRDQHFSKRKVRPDHLIDRLVGAVKHRDQKETK